MKKDNRPLSPHLQIYKLPITAKMSILHRATGVASVLGLVIVTLWLAATSSGSQGWFAANKILTNPLITFILFIWSAALIYHLCNGVRHLLWDSGRCLTISSAKKANYVVQLVTVVLTLVVWIAISVGG